VIKWPVAIDVRKIHTFDFRDMFLGHKVITWMEILFGIRLKVITEAPVESDT
jgi:hypothetical protein